MCGIAGILGGTHARHVDAMLDALAHRGPDDHGVYFDERHGLALGHRRLSIIDLTAAAHQPMSSTDSRYRIVYNGEIYNFVALREELAGLGHTFLSHSDTEVILASYAQWGVRCLSRFRGMFAFALWDCHKGELFLARDRFGIKPLFYVRKGEMFAFASELKAVLATDLVCKRVDRQALWDYLSFGSVVQPRTILEEVKALLPGHYCIVRPDGMTFHRYWDIEEATRIRRGELQKMEYADAVRELRSQLLDATRHHLVADVPVGAFLSGGIDSTAVVALMSQVVQQPIRTYSIGFESHHRHMSELTWARIASAAFGTLHQDIVVTGDDISSAFDAVIAAIDQPSHDGFNSYLVSRAARQGVTVALSGLGGDELLAGYPHFRYIQTSASLAPDGLGLLTAPARGMTRMLPRQWRQRASIWVSPPDERLALLRRFMNEGQKRKALSAEFLNAYEPLDSYSRYRGLLRDNLDVVAQVSYVELCGYLRDTLLRDIDVMSMSHSLEVRPVLLDHVLAEFVFGVPSEFKLRGSVHKRMFLDALDDLIPREILHRAKMGFELPLTDWLSTSLHDRAVGTFDSPLAHRLFSPAFLRNTRDELEGNNRPSMGTWSNFVLLEYLHHARLEV